LWVLLESKEETRAEIKSIKIMHKTVDECLCRGRQGRMILRGCDKL